MTMMPRILFATALSALIGITAQADLLGLVVFRETVGGFGPAPPGPERWIYRVYAEFTNGNDEVLGWGTGGAFGPGSIQNITINGTPGSGFTNVPNNATGDLAPQSPGTARDWDTYMTVGVLYGQEGVGGVDASFVLIGTPMFIANGASAWGGTQFDAGVVLAPNEPDLTQGRPSYRVSGFDTEDRVLLMQLVVNAGDHVSGTMGVSWRPEGGQFQITEDLSFSSIPCPATTLVFLLLTIRQKRRR